MQLKEIWENSLEIISRNINSQVSYSIYIKDAVPLELRENILTVSVPMNINKNMIECRYKSMIETAVSSVTGRNIILNVIVQTEPEIETEEEEFVVNTSRKNLYNINEKYTFANFVIGASNEFASAAAIRAAENPGRVYNSLFIYGNSGLGKTHLMHAIGNEIAINFPDYKIVYVTSEKFTNDFINSVREKDMQSFRQLYRKADVLLIDDIQFFAKKEQTQEEFFHTFNELYNLNKQIVIASDRKPKDLITLEERLKTRFEQGLVIDISVPSYETRVAILQNKAMLKGVTIDEAIISYIADNIQTNIRELEGALLKIISSSQIRNIDITMELAQNELKSFLEDDARRKFSSSKIIDKVCSYYSISKQDIIGKSKVKNIALARQVGMYLCKNMTKMNYGEIARDFGNRDRTTALHNVEKIRVEIKTNQLLKEEVEYIMKDIQEN